MGSDALTNIPWSLANVPILATIILLGVFVLSAWRKYEMKTGIRCQSYAVLALGISICLVGAFLMAAGESFLGTDHTGIATIAGIVGIGIIALSAQLIIASSRRTMH